MKKLVILRRISQTSFFALFVYVLWSTTYPLKGLVPPDVFFQVDPLAVFFTSVAERVLLSGIATCAVMMLLTMIIGRFFCGWVCPLGAVIDAAASLRKRGKSGLDDSVGRSLRKPKFIVLAIVALSAVFGVQIAWVFDPTVIAARFVSLNLIPALTAVIDRVFVAVISGFDAYGAVYDLYRLLKTSFLGVNIHFFSNSAVIFLYFLSAVVPALWLTRFWCRAVCPLGAFYSIAARPARLERRVSNCIKCGKCQTHCRMGAIADDLSYKKGECILCMDCVYDCPPLQTRFTFRRKIANSFAGHHAGGITRMDFLTLVGLSVPFLGGRHSAQKPTLRGGADRRVIRPPGSLREDHFVDRCIRCGNCMKVCITNGLQPVSLESGWEGIWTPQLVPEIGYCEYSCTLCGNVCPTSAIGKLPLEEKKKAKIGTAHIDKKLCIAWSQNKECLVCEEHCPVFDKAIKVREESLPNRKILKPVVNEAMCIGCGICQNVCPTRPVRAIRVRP